MRNKSLSMLLAAGLALVFLPAPLAAQSSSENELQKRITKMEQELEQLKTELASAVSQAKNAKQEAEERAEDAKRLDVVERKAALDRLNFSGEIRVAADSIHGTQAAFFDGLALQKGIVDSMFYLQSNAGAFPMPIDPNDPASIYQVLANNVAAHYADYQYFLSQLSFDNLKAALGLFPAEQQQALFGLLLPNTARAQQDYDNSIIYTTRLRLNMKAEINDHFSFAGRLAMYKAWGDSTGVQVFNGLPNSINVDGTTTSVPNSDIVRVDRAYFDWRGISDTGLYLSMGRRPSTGGPPTEIREHRLRGGTPLAHVVDYQFDGITVGYNFDTPKLPGAVYRFCYGVGYESGFGSADQLRAPADRLKDVHFGGLNLDLYSTDRMYLHGTVLRAWRVTDGFNSLAVLPVDPVSGNPVPAPVVLRFTPSANLGDIDLGAILMERHDGPLNWFASYAGMKSHPNNITTPFGGLFSDPFEVPESRSGHSLYLGARYDFPNGATFLGAEYNYGSKYWFNFTHAADDLVLSKLATRGNVVEVYFIHELGNNVQFRIAGMDYNYKYSGSGWHLMTPKKLNEMPILAFPTYKDVFDLRMAMTVKF